MTPTLQGIRVIDAASFLAGPCAATIMSDYGADVIKIEPLYGDGHRRLSGTYPVDYTWQLTSRNKRSLALDFTQRRRAATCCCGWSNLPTSCCSTCAPISCSATTCRTRRCARRNPRLIYAQISGYGLEGDESARRAFDITGWFARTGILDVMHDKDIAPAPPAGGVGDHATAMTLFGAIMLALYRREQTGEGAMVSTSLAVTGAWANGLTLAGVLAGIDSTAAPRRRRLVESVQQHLRDRRRTSPDACARGAEAGVAAAREGARASRMGRRSALRGHAFGAEEPPRVARADRRPALRR